MAINISTDPVPGSGQLSFSVLREKLKQTSEGQINMGELYRNGNVVKDSPENVNLPTSGELQLSDFRNVISFKIATITNTEQNLNAQTIFGTSVFQSAIPKQITINGFVISQNSNPALEIPSGSGSTIQINLTSGGIFGARGTPGGGGGSGGRVIQNPTTFRPGFCFNPVCPPVANPATFTFQAAEPGGTGAAGSPALRTYSSIRINGSGANISGGGGAGGGGGGCGREGSAGSYYYRYCCGWFCPQCSACASVGGGGDSGGNGGAGGAGQGYTWNGTSSTPTLNPAVGGSGGTSGGGGTGGTGGPGGTFGSSGSKGNNGPTGNSGPSGNCAAGGGGTSGGPGGPGGPSGGSIIGYNRVESISSTSVLKGPTSNT